jgi:hypothetical protein
VTKTHRKTQDGRLHVPANRSGDESSDVAKATQDLEPLFAQSSWLTPLHDALALAESRARRVDAQKTATRIWQRNGGWLIDRSGRS